MYIGKCIRLWEEKDHCTIETLSGMSTKMKVRIINKCCNYTIEINKLGE